MKRNGRHDHQRKNIAEGGIIGIRPSDSELHKSLIVFQLLIAVTSAPLLAIHMLAAVNFYDYDLV